MHSLEVQGSAGLPVAVVAYCHWRVGDDLKVIIRQGPAQFSIEGDTSVDGELAILRYVESLGEGRSSNSTDHSLVSLSKQLGSSTLYKTAMEFLHALDSHLMWRTFVAGRSLLAADFIIWANLRASPQCLGLLKSGGLHHASRWMSYMDSLEASREALSLILKASKPAETSPVLNLKLPHIVHGSVVTRFPPEPSGYMHIGHLKAALFNATFAAQHGGKFIVRMDDTNPAKENAEFENAILEDLSAMNVVPDQVTHTSQHFDILHGYALQMIRDGNAYVDDTPIEELRAQRKMLQPSKCRERSIEENMQLFERMTTKSDDEHADNLVLRAKMKYDDVNGALRDPTLYRCVDVIHHRVGSKYRAFPTYDFACPIVDSVEGVTHAFRTNEYRDRNAQYMWILDALGLRKPVIYDFSRIGFVYTVMSKRQLRKCIEIGLASGWDDPRFPTFRGIRRRGMTVEALKQYIISQGPSQNQILLEWDGIWSLNKRILDPIVPRYWAIEKLDMVPVFVEGAPDGVTFHELPRHKKNTSLGLKKVAFSRNILIEQADAASFGKEEEITLMNWGNVIIKRIERADEGRIVRVNVLLNLEGDFKATTKKITWLSSGVDLLECRLIRYGHLVTKAQVQKGDDIEAIANRQGEIVSLALGDPNISQLLVGTSIQFERKGYYRLDAIRTTSGVSVYDFIQIPDGRAASLVAPYAI